MPAPRATEPRTPCCIVVSHYNAWPTDQLIALLDQILTIPAGAPFHVRVVVNQALPTPLSLPERLAGVEVFHRPNRGYNIGAWDHGWRMEPRFDFYVFLQEECVILRKNWLAAFVRKASAPGVGLVGESMTGEASWTRLKGQSVGWRRIFDHPKPPVDSWFQQIEEVARERGIDLGPDVRHLQSLVLAARREVLEEIGGFESDAVAYRRAVMSEILASKAAVTKGFNIRQAGLLPFTYVSHPQWKRPFWQEVLYLTILDRVPARLRWFSYLAYHKLRKEVSRPVSLLTRRVDESPTTDGERS